MINDVEHYFDDLFYQFMKERPSKLLQKKMESSLLNKINQINQLKSTTSNSQYQQLNTISLIEHLEDAKAKVKEIDETLNNLY